MARMKNPQGAHAESIHQAITTALKRQARREARHITIEVTDGVVVVLGVVHSLDEKDAVLAAARETRGVEHVESRLVVRS